MPFRNNQSKVDGQTLNSGFMIIAAANYADGKS
jgi:hypothetical protein